MVVSITLALAATSTSMNVLRNLARSGRDIWCCGLWYIMTAYNLSLSVCVDIVAACVLIVSPFPSVTVNHLAKIVTSLLQTDIPTLRRNSHEIVTTAARNITGKSQIEKMRWTDFKEAQEDQITLMSRKITKITEKHRPYKAGRCFFVGLHGFALACHG